MNYPKLEIQVSAECYQDEILLAKQLGADSIYCWLPDEYSNEVFIKTLKREAEANDLELRYVGNIRLSKSDKIILNLDGREKMLDEFCDFIKMMGDIGIPYNGITFEPTRVWSSGRIDHRGCSARYVDFNEMEKRSFTHQCEYKYDEIFDNFCYMMDRVLPVAQKSNVNIALHPNDPPMPFYGGIASLVYNSDCYRKIFDIYDTPNLGMKLCVGCWLEGGLQGFGDVLYDIKEFCIKDKIFIVHFRNIDKPLPIFKETFLEDGYMDMSEVIKALIDNDYKGSITMDHSPIMINSTKNGVEKAYGAAYIRAMMNSI